MKCPKCGREMEDGFLEWQNRDNLAWVPKLGLFASLKDGAELLWPTIETFTKSGSRAYICRVCKHVLMEYGELK